MIACPTLPIASISGGFDKPSRSCDISTQSPYSLWDIMNAFKMREIGFLVFVLKDLYDNCRTTKETQSAPSERKLTDNEVDCSTLCADLRRAIDVVLHDLERRTFLEVKPELCTFVDNGMLSGIEVGNAFPAAIQT
jgi:hypothetical protein